MQKYIYIFLLILKVKIYILYLNALTDNLFKDVKSGLM